MQYRYMQCVHAAHACMAIKDTIRSDLISERSLISGHTCHMRPKSQTLHEIQVA